MDYKTTYLADPARCQLAREYLVHEMKKLKTHAVPDGAELCKVTSGEHSILVKQLWSHFETNHSDYEAVLSAVVTSTRALWTLFHAVSYGLLKKELYNCVGSPGRDWFLETQNPLTLQMGTPLLVGRMARQLGPVPVHEVLTTAQSLSEETLKTQIQVYDRDSRDNRKDDPLIATEHGLGIFVQDGNGRIERACCKAALEKSKTLSGVRVWIGRYRDPSVGDMEAYDEAIRDIFVTSQELFWRA